MEIFVYRNGTHKVEILKSAANLPEILADEQNFVWIDMEAATAEQEERILAGVFNFHPLTIEDCRLNHSQPKVEEFPDYLYFIFHGVRTDTTSRNFVTKELDGYLGKNYLVTYHHETFRSIEAIKKQILASPISCQRGGAYLLHQILDYIIDLYVPVIEDFDAYIIKLEDRIFRLNKADNRILAEILRLKRNVIRLRRISSKQLDILYRLSHGEFRQIDAAMLPFYRDVYDHLLRVSDLAENYREIASGLMDTYHSVLANKTNEVMKILTLLSAVMLPLTVIAGIYGMNFENMPELKTRFGYFIVLCIMALVAGVMLFWFWRKGWLGEGEDNGKKKSSKDEEDLVNITLTD